MISRKIVSFEALFNHASLGIVIVDERGKIVAANPFLLGQFQYEADELEGLPIEYLIPSRFHDQHRQYVAHYSQYPRSRPMGLGMNLFACRKDGSEFPVEVGLGSYDTEEGRYIIAFLSDISMRKKAEDALKQLNAALEDKVEERTRSLTNMVEQLAQAVKEMEEKDSALHLANNFFENMWNHAQAIIFTTDKKGKINMFNSTAEKRLGYRANEIIKKATPDIFILLKESAEEAIPLHEQTQSTFQKLTIKADLGLLVEHEVEFVERGGRRFPTLLTLSAIRNIHGEIDGYLGIAADISKRKRAETELRSALQKEKELNELKSRFVSMASHEFRTPLSAISLSVYLISQYISEITDARVEKQLRQISFSVNLLTDILNDFLSVDKIEEGKIQVHYCVFHVQQHLEQIVNELSALKKKGQSVIYRHIGAEKICLDPTIIKHIVSNLLSNAVKFSPEGSTIEMITESEGSLFRLQVSDRGIGISEEDQQHLFERFYRGTNVTHIQGTGLGLHIVSKYAQLMNGTISCQSTLGEGTTFKLVFKTRDSWMETDDISR